MTQCSVMNVHSCVPVWLFMRISLGLITWSRTDTSLYSMCINWVWVISVDWLFLSPFPQAVHEGVSTWPHPHWQLVLSRCLILACVTDTKQYLTAVVICFPLITEGFDMFLICCWPFGFPLQYIFCSCFLPIRSWKFLSSCFFFFAEILYIFQVVVCWHQILQCILPKVTCLLTLSMLFFAE